MAEFNLIKCPQFLDNAITPPAKEIGKTLGNIFYAIFSPINFSVDKLRIKHLENLKSYKQEIQLELDKIPENNLTEPKISIVGPALEASKFYIEEEPIRIMFAKLIASSMNFETNSYTHHSFVEIIKQLNPLDAVILKIISSDNSGLPIVKYNLFYKGDNKGFFPLATNVFLNIAVKDDITTNSVAISNLERLGLVNIDYQTYRTDEKAYFVFKQHPYYKDYESFIKQGQQDPAFLYKSIDIKKGIVSITPFGNNFINICV